MLRQRASKQASKGSPLSDFLLRSLSLSLTVTGGEVVCMTQLTDLLRSEHTNELLTGLTGQPDRDKFKSFCGCFRFDMLVKVGLRKSESNGYTHKSVFSAQADERPISGQIGSHA